MALLFVPVSSPNNAAALTETVALRGATSAPRVIPNDGAGQQGFSCKCLTFASLFGAGTLGVANMRAPKSKKIQKIMAMAFDPSVQDGVTQPLGFFDPLGFSKVKDEKGFRQLRVAEIKHGRVAMMASIGMVLPHFWRATGFESVPCGLGAVFTETGGLGFAALVLGAGLHELVLWKDDDKKDAGDFGDPFKFSEQINVERNYELNNGRMAMFAILGQVVAEITTGKDAVQQLGF